MRIKVIKKTFLEFLDLIQLRGVLPSGKSGYINEKALLVATNNELRAENLDDTHVVYTNIKMKRVEIATPGQLPIEDLSEFIKIIKNFRGKNLTIEFDKISIKISDGVKTVSYKVSSNLSALKTVEESMIQLTENGYRYNLGELTDEIKTSVDITSDEMKSVTADGNLGESRIFPIEYADNKLKINITNDYDNGAMSFSNTFEVDVATGPNASTKVSYGFDNIFKNIKGQVELLFNEKFPLVIVCNSKDIDFLGLLGSFESEENFEDITEEDADSFFD